ncbi:MAG: hypothetical protein JNM57_09445 [Cyclobacteriaceae bacterium]|nr:hypothetical protein [Cyclobacteriaceae bacterium]
MKDFSFHAGTLPFGYRYGFESALFNLREHLLLQAKQGWHSFYIVHQKDFSIEACIHFHIIDGVARSPLNSPFGAIECSANVPPIVLFQFVAYFESRLKELDVKRIIIKQAPVAYDQQKSSLVQTFLWNQNYRVTVAEVGAVIAVSDAAFDAKIHAWEKRKLRQAQALGIIFQHISADRLEEVYTFILKCRQEKGYSLSMSLSSLAETIQSFPDHFLLVGAFLQNEMVAASISIRVRKNVLYNFYSSHAVAYDSLSPVVSLVEGLYQYCQGKSIELLDLGTSAQNGQPNFGLLDFKLRLGAEPASKLTFEKELLS